MNLTVQQMIDQGGFSDFQIYAGEAGLRTREIKTVCVIDTPDIEGWLFGGEFLLTSGYIFKDNPEQLRGLIETASRANAAALGIKMERYIDRIPQDVLRIADRLSFPLIGIPHHYAHTDIINPVLVTISDNMARMMHISDEIRKEFFNILITGEPLDSLLSLLNRYIKRELLFVNTTTGERCALANSVEFNQVIDSVPLASLIEHFPHEKLVIGTKTRGYLFLNRSISETQSEIALMQAKDALQLYLKWEHERWKIERGRDAQFVQDILYKRFHHDSEILSRGRILTWDLSGRQVVVLIDINKEKSFLQEPQEPYNKGFEMFRNMLSELQNNVPYSPLEDGMAFILSAPAEKWNSIKSRLTGIFNTARHNIRLKTGLQLVMGVGSPVTSILSCDKSFREAVKTLSAAKQNSDVTPTLFWEDMGVYKFLASSNNTPEAKEFITEQLGKLINNGVRDEDSMLQTLFCIIRNNWQLKAVAAQMNLHYNTVKYRYHKIKEILGADTDLSAVRISLTLAMELYILNNSGKEKNS